MNIQNQNPNRRNSQVDLKTCLEYTRDLEGGWNVSLDKIMEGLTGYYESLAYYILGTRKSWKRSDMS